MQQACADGDYPAAMKVQDRLLPLHDALFVEPSPAGAKYAGSLLGLCEADARLPVVELASDTKKRIEKAVKDLGLADTVGSISKSTAGKKGEALSPA